MYTFYLGELKLPVTPSRVTITTGSLNKTLTLVEGSEINIPKSQRLREIAFNILIPSVEYPFSNYEGNYKDRDYYKDALENLKKENRVIAFVITRTMGNRLFNYTGIYAVVEELEFIEDADNGYDLKARVKLREYKEYGAEFYPNANVTTQTLNTTTTQTNGSYTVKSGDSLWKIAKANYGDGTRWKEIYDNNKNTIANPDKLKVGTVIVLP